MKMKREAIAPPLAALERAVAASGRVAP